MAKAQNTQSKMWKRPFKNAGILLLGRGTQGILSLVYLALAARTLGAAGFGNLVIIHSLVLTAAQLIRFQTWQAVMRYGDDALKQNDIKTFQDINLFAVFLDFISAVICAGGLILFLNYCYGITGLQAEIEPLAKLYALGSIFVMLGSAPLGYLRLADRHDLIAIQTTVEPAIRFIGAIILFFINGPLEAFLILWFAAMTASRITLMVIAVRTMRKENLWSDFTVRPAKILHPVSGIWRYVCGTQLTSTLNITNGPIGTILAGALLGAPAAGIFRVAQQFADILIKPVNKLLVPAIYTDMTQSAGNRTILKDLSVKTALFAGAPSLGIFIILVAAGKVLITATVGTEYLGAYTPMIILALSGIAMVATFPLEPLLITAGKVRETALIRFLTVLIYFLGFLALAPLFGITGAATATAISTVCTALLFWLSGALYLKEK
ncbi:MAG: oligosaccharide flippase family protein [Alphaproteobacteria bacterium]|jgi:O-antigen/teichoic acid export membrane protein|nr:oligosaccharide flippase family protein [Alphaproteobacteria bacterium]MDP7222107.1 oligosaccharide flippase family protein [Alphaproteobacteria bacterium]